MLELFYDYKNYVNYTKWTSDIKFKSVWPFVLRTLLRGFKVGHLYVKRNKFQACTMGKMHKRWLAKCETYALVCELFLLNESRVKIIGLSDHCSSCQIRKQFQKAMECLALVKF